MADSPKAARSTADSFALNLVAELDRHCKRGRDRIDAFVEYRCQVEDWFKGELLMIAANMLSNGIVTEFKPDRRIGTSNRMNIDLRFQLTNGRRVWIELKHWGSRSKPATHCSQMLTESPINNFVTKLPAEWRDPTYLLAVTTPTPGETDWQKAMLRLKERQAHRRFRALTKPGDFPKEYFLALLRV